MGNVIWIVLGCVCWVAWLTRLAFQSSNSEGAPKAPSPTTTITRRPQNVAFCPERIVEPAGKLDQPCPECAIDADGASVPCAFWKGHEHPCRFIRIQGVVHVCGICGSTFEIDASDPHWSTGRGPICPLDSAERKHGQNLTATERSFVKWWRS